MILTAIIAKVTRDPYSDQHQSNSRSLRRSPPTYFITESGLSLIKLLLILLTHGGTDTNWALVRGHGYRYINIHSAEVAHCTHTTEPMASHSHSDGPTMFRQNRSTAVTLSRPLRPKSPTGWSWVASCLPKTPRPPSWSKLPLGDTPTRGLDP